MVLYVMFFSGYRNDWISDHQPDSILNHRDCIQEELIPSLIKKKKKVYKSTYLQCLICWNESERAKQILWSEEPELEERFLDALSQSWFRFAACGKVSWTIPDALKIWICSWTEVIRTYKDDCDSSELEVHSLEN